MPSKYKLKKRRTAGAVGRVGDPDGCRLEIGPPTPPPTVGGPHVHSVTSLTTTENSLSSQPFQTYNFTRSCLSFSLCIFYRLLLNMFCASIHPFEINDSRTKANTATLGLLAQEIEPFKFLVNDGNLCRQTASSVLFQSGEAVCLVPRTDRASPDFPLCSSWNEKDKVAQALRIMFQDDLKTERRVSVGRPGQLALQRTGGRLVAARMYGRPSRELELSGIFEVE
jgi:hypothetical protein